VEVDALQTPLRRVLRRAQRAVPGTDVWVSDWELQKTSNTRLSQVRDSDTRQRERASAVHNDAPEREPRATARDDPPQQEQRATMRDGTPERTQHATTRDDPPQQEQRATPESQNSCQTIASCTSHTHLTHLLAVKTANNVGGFTFKLDSNVHETTLNRKKAQVQYAQAKATQRSICRLFILLVSVLSISSVR
jgi:hypothetical protein